MNPIFPHRGPALGAGTDGAELSAGRQFPPSTEERRACCCPGRPVVRVTIPASPSRPRPADLLLCGHHYRVSRAAIAAAHGTVEELPGRSADVAAALFTSTSQPAAVAR